MFWRGCNNTRVPLSLGVHPTLLNSGQVGGLPTLYTFPHSVHKLILLNALCVHVQSAQVMALMLPGAGAALDKEQAQLDNVVVAHGFRPPLPREPPSFVPMVTPPAPIGYVEGHRPLFLLDTSSKTMARRGRMGLMRDVLTALVQPGGEVRVLVPTLMSRFPVQAWTLFPWDERAREHNNIRETGSRASFFRAFFGSFAVQPIKQGTGGVHV